MRPLLEGGIVGYGKTLSEFSIMGEQARTHTRANFLSAQLTTSRKPHPILFFSPSIVPITAVTDTISGV